MKTLFTITLALFLTGCYATNPVRTLPQGSDAMTLSIGTYVYEGRMIFPIGSIGYYGAPTDWLTIGGNIYPQALFNANLAMEGTAMFRIIKGDKLAPELTGSLGTYFYHALGDVSYTPGTSFLPFARVNGSSKVSDKVMLFLGSEWNTQSDLKSVAMSPSAGIVFSNEGTVSAQVEAKVLGLVGISEKRYENDTPFRLNTNATVGLYFGYFIHDLFQKHNL